MAIQINGNGTITGVSVGGLPDGIVDTDMLAANAVTAAKKGSGSILQVQNTYTNGQVSTTSTDWATTGVTVSITPSATTSKIFLNFSNSHYNGTNNHHCYFAYFRDSTNLGSDSNGQQLVTGATANGLWNTISMSYLDSPNTTSSVTYSIRWKLGSQGGTSYLMYASSMNLSFTAMEIAA